MVTLSCCLCTHFSLRIHDPSKTSADEFFFFPLFFLTECDFWIHSVITQCCITHLIQLAADGSQIAQEAVDLARTLCERRKCNHWKTKTSSIECIQGVVGSSENRLRYLIATQDQSFRTHLRQNVVGVPILYVNRSGLLLLEEEGPASELKRKEVTSLLYLPKVF